MVEPALVSVIVPVYDAPETLGRAVASVRAQTYRPVELVVVDDGSADGGRAAAASRPDVLVVRSARGGPAVTRNEGARAAAGSILAFLDADDRWSEDKLAVSVEHLAESGDELAVGWFRYEAEPGAAIPAHFDRRLFEREHVGQIPSALVVRRETFERLGGFDESRMTAEDVEWFARVARSGLRVGVVPGVHLVKGVGERNLSLRHGTARRDLFGALHAGIRARRAGGGGAGRG